MPPQMKIQCVLNEEKALIREKNDLSIESNEVTHVVSLDTNNLSVRVLKRVEKTSDKAFQFLD